MVNWDDVKVGDTLYEEHWIRELVYFMPMKVVEKDEVTVVLRGPDSTLVIPKVSFPYERLHLGGEE